MMTMMPPTAIERLHKAVKRYLENWCDDAAGPWWEGDLSGQLYGVLREYFPASDSSLIKIHNPPSFLERWPAPRFRRLTAEFHVRGEGRGTYPDFSYRSEDGGSFEWVLELKTWSVACVTVQGVQREGEALVEVMFEDIRKWLRREDCQYVLAFATVNSPTELEARRKASLPDNYLKTFVGAARSALDKNTRELDAYAGTVGSSWDLGIICKEISEERVISHRSVCTRRIQPLLKPLGQ